MLETLTLSTAHIFIFITFIMISWTSLLVLCSVLSPALCCDWLRHYGHYSNISLTLIRLMGGQLTEQDSPVSFPYKFYKHIRNSEVRSKVVFIRDSLVQISDLYRHDNLSSVTWDMDNTNRFRMSIDRQIDGLNTCVSEQRHFNSFHASPSYLHKIHMVRLQLLLYFIKLKYMNYFRYKYFHL
uniref:Uncharacterized protein n=1 Tax=Seriola lalandi dorsalis TaxID=1841481 RepID=A0A3B4WSS9_SERLL